MLFATLPTDYQSVKGWTWEQFAPYYADLLARDLTAATVDTWLADWSLLGSLLDETQNRLMIATSINTVDEVANQQMTAFLDDVIPAMSVQEQALKEKLIASELHPTGFDMPLRKMRTEAGLFREANIPLLNAARKQGLEYEKLAGARSVQWEGVEIPLTQLAPVQRDPDRGRRERAWRTANARLAQDTAALTPLWRQMITTRHQLAVNAGYPNYREYRWQQMFRFDYTPADAKQFHAAIAATVVPVVQRYNEQRRQQLGVPTLRQWDLTVDPNGRQPVHPYQSLGELTAKATNIFRQVDLQFASYFETMQANGLLDLDSRKNKAAGGYSVSLAVTKQPFIFMNAVGTHSDVQTLLHEGGHAFHSFEVVPLPYLQQRQEQMVPIEFAEVASMAMELLGSPYLTSDKGGFYTPAEAARERIDHLQDIIRFWPYMAMIDALQHWVYEHETDEGADLASCDRYWATLVDRFLPDLDWSGAEAEKQLYWHRQLHVFQEPFYYIEYGIAQLGAVQVWANSLRNPQQAVADYRRALALGGMATLPELYAAAGAKFAFDTATLQQAIALIGQTIQELEPIANS